MRRGDGEGRDEGKIGRRGVKFMGGNVERERERVIRKGRSKRKNATETKMEGRLLSDAFGSERHTDCVFPRREKNHLSN
jgi:hypothetical protein